MKFLPFLVLPLAACATVSPQRQHLTAGASESPTTYATVTISGDDLQRTGRSELSDALRAVSPIFH